MGKYRRLAPMRFGGPSDRKSGDTRRLPVNMLGLTPWAELGRPFGGWSLVDH